MEADIVPAEGFPFTGISASGLERKLSPRNLLALWQAVRGFCQAVEIIGRWRPEAVIGTGGYVCGPVVLAAVLKRIPTLIHEQNALPGVTNRILSRFASRVAITFADSLKYFPDQSKVRLTGLPVRPEILQADRKTGLQKLGIKEGRFFLLSFGGSRGARSINGAMLTVIKAFAGNPDVEILHATGKAGYQKFLDGCRAAGIELDKIGNVTVKEYIYNMQDALAAADLVVSRAGAATLAELTALGIPSILVPYPYASENHQEFNARALEKEGAALVILDRQLNGGLLSRTITELINDRARLQAMAAASRKMGKNRALEDIIDCIDELIRSKRRHF